MDNCRAVVKVKEGWSVEQFGGDNFVFKCGDSWTQNRVYHELKTRIMLPVHPKLVEKPSMIVHTESKRTDGAFLVCEFLERYHNGGSLEDALPSMLKNGTLHVAVQRPLIRVIFSALIHLKENVSFFPNLSPRNIRLNTEGGTMARLLNDVAYDDGLYNWAPHAVYYAEIVAELSLWTVPDSLRESRGSNVPDKFKKLWKNYLGSKNYENIKEWYKAQIQLYPTQLPRLQLRTSEYFNPELGFYHACYLILIKEREFAQVYILGRLMWSIFEGEVDGNNIFRDSPIYESAPPFPIFQRTPESMRALIKQCTAGASEWNQGPIPLDRVSGWIYPRGATGAHGTPIATLPQTKGAIQGFWLNEIGKAEMFLRAKIRRHTGFNPVPIDDITILSFLSERPTLQEVMDRINRFEQSLWDGK